MNWVLGIIGAIVGMVVSDSRIVLGAFIGFFSLYLLTMLLQLRHRVDAQDRELAILQSKQEPQAAAPPQARPAPSATPEPPSSESATTSVESLSAELGDVGRECQAEAARLALIKARQEKIRIASVANSAHATSPKIPMWPDTPTEPSGLEKFLDKIKSWFTEGNVPVKIGVLVLFAGVAAALRYAAAEGYFTFPVELRLMVIAMAALLALGFGWRERERRPAFGLSLQGGAIGVLLLTVFAAYKLYFLLPPTLAFALIVVLVAGAALLSLLQENKWLAVLGFLGGYLAPVLINTGSNNYIGLFSYYAVLNAAVFAISWKRNWRLLNLIGFAFTFGVGTAWGSSHYRSEMFATVEPFLILFFVFYLVIGLLYVIRQTEHRRPWVDGTLVFGTPLVAFPLQAVLLKDNDMALAFSALVVALVYAGLVYYLRRRGERLLTEAYGALALGFATLAIPLAFSASTTASLWALEGAGVAWLGIRQNRTFPWLSGLLLQLLAAGSYVISLQSHLHYLSEPLLMNTAWLGAAILAFSGYALSLIHDRHRPINPLAALLFCWATFWWLVGARSQFDQAELGVGIWHFLMLYLSITLAIAALLRSLLAWSRLNWLIAVGAVLGLLMVLEALDEFGAPLNASTLPMWSLFAVVMLWALWGGREVASRSLAASHVLGLWWLAVIATFQLDYFSDTQQLAQGWNFLVDIAPLTLMTLGLWRRPQVLAWPRAERFQDYRWAWFVPALLLLAMAFIVGLFLEGSAAPLMYIPLLNPLELALIAIAALLLRIANANDSSWGDLRRLWPIVGFIFISLATLRAVHHGHGEVWGMSVLDSGFTQTSLTIVWSLLGVSSWVLGSKRGNRKLWIAGALLMGIVLGKLVIVDRLYMGNIPGIVSFLAVGLLLVGVGYFAPSPPKIERGEPA